MTPKSTSNLRHHPASIGIKGSTPLGQGHRRSGDRCCALIEARSAERMKLLAWALPDPELSTFYQSLLATEARHHMTCIDPVLDRAEAATVWSRLHELAAHEAEVLNRPMGPLRMHS